MENLYHFFNNTLIQLSIYDWKLNLVSNSTEGYCWQKRKIIDIGIENRDQKRLILHEISHINTCRFCNNKHDSTFWELYKDLLYRFLKKGFDESDLLHKKHSDGIGYYKLCYKREMLNIKEEVKTLYCPDCKIPMRAYLTNAGGERIL